MATRSSLIARALVATVFAVAAAAPRARADAPEPGTPAGLVVSIEGDVVVERDGEPLPTSEGFVLREGDVVLAREGGRCTGFTPFGDAFDLPGPGQLTLVAADASMIGRASAWIRSQIADWIGESRRQPIVTRTLTRDWKIETMTPAQLLPAPNGSVRPERSVFYWETVPGIDTYEIVVVDESGDETRRMVRDHRVVLTDLSPGGEYAWKVEPSVRGWKGRASWRSFRVMGASEEKKLDDAVRTMDDLEAGVLLLSAGLHEDAVYRFDAAVSRGRQAASARRWLAQAMADIGLYREAYVDLLRSWGQM
jgi:hypothetical protein